MLTGTLYNTVKLQALTNEWMQKKDSGNVLSKKELEKRENWSADERMVHDFEQQMIDNREASKRQEIINKITAGSNLTAEEEQYLQKNDPEALKRYHESKAEKKAYEEKLRNCKTKDEVNRLKTETVNGYLSAMKKIEHNPYIPISEKMAKAQELLSKTRNISEAEMKFMQTAEYKNLPTEAEEAIEATKEREAVAEQVEAELEENKEDASSLEEKDTEVADVAGQTPAEKLDNLDQRDLHNKRNKDARKINEDTTKEIENIYHRILLNYDLENSDDFRNSDYAGKTGAKKTGTKMNFYI